MAAEVESETQFQTMCVERHTDGSLTEAKGDECLEQTSCVVTDPDGDAEVYPITACNNYICHSPRDYERIMNWGRKHCD